MRKIFQNRMIKAHCWFKCLEKLIEQRFPKIAEVFKKLHFIGPSYASNWIFTLFIKGYPKKFTLRLWDIFLVEGWPVIFSIGLRIVQRFEQQILQAETIFDIVTLFRNMAEDESLIEILSVVQDLSSPRKKKGNKGSVNVSHEDLSLLMNDYLKGMDSAYVDLR